MGWHVVRGREGGRGGCDAGCVFGWVKEGGLMERRRMVRGWMEARRWGRESLGM